MGTSLGIIISLSFLLSFIREVSPPRFRILFIVLLTHMKQTEKHSGRDSGHELHRAIEHSRQSTVKPLNSAWPVDFNGS